MRGTDTDLIVIHGAVHVHIRGTELSLAIYVTVRGGAFQVRAYFDVGLETKTLEKVPTKMAPSRKF